MTATPYTGNDIYDANCNCAGQLIDCLGVPGGSALVGTACDDSNALTGNDIYDANCNCAGQLIDCLGVPGGTALVGTACDDGNAGHRQRHLRCQLQLCWSAHRLPRVPGGTALVGTACADSNTNTGTDIYDANCNCAGQLIDCLGVPGGTALVGTACDDGNASTVNDIWSAGCVCIGQSVDCTSEAGPDQEICGLTSTMQAAGAGQWTGPSGISFTDLSDAQTIVNASLPGVYDLYWTVTNGTCIEIDTVSVTFNLPSDASFAYALSTYCHGDPSATPWTAQPGGTFMAFPSGLILNPISGAISIGSSDPGSYQVTYYIAGNCPASQTQSVTVAAGSDASWTAPGPLCSSNSPIALDPLVIGTPGGSWQGQGVANGIFNPAGLAGSIELTYSATIGSCTDELSQFVLVLEPPVADAGPDITACGLRTAMNAVPFNGNATWTLPAGITSYTPETSATMEIGGAAYGSYLLVWSVTNGSCYASDTALVNFVDPGSGIWVNAGEDQHLAVIDFAHLSGSAMAGAALNWWVLNGSGTIDQPSDSATTISGLSFGDNLVVLTASINQCASISDTVLLHVDDLFIPEGYSPNGDGVNDRWEIRGVEAYPNSSLQVFNRWGKLVYEAEDYSNEWEGRARNGQPLPDDTYFFVLNLTGRRSYNGHVIIKR
ncbi:MAG: gliding motility-associated C-terminal domain-containing protein [Flavobacteriales bacterium]|nr:gliding motility-associated C-terminal domain-containing protein [Flavobacteriales bacterium]